LTISSKLSKIRDLAIIVEIGAEVMTKTLVYSKMCTVKPDVRDILWAYERDHNLDKAVSYMAEVLDRVWNYAIYDSTKNQRR
jgi:hypothetical protein